MPAPPKTIYIGSHEEREREREEAKKQEEARVIEQPPPQPDGRPEPKTIDCSHIDATPDVVPTIKMPPIPDLPPDPVLTPDTNPLPAGFKTTLLITTYKRDRQTKHGILSVLEQNPDELNVQLLVLDDAAQESTERMCIELGVPYLATRIIDPCSKPPWRTPAYAFNIGCRHTQSDAIFLSCGEMFHVKQCLEKLLAVLAQDPMALAVPKGYDDNGDILATLNAGNQPTLALVKSMGELNTRLPFLMGFKRSHFELIGGYDEDMCGMAFDDDDIVWRLLQLGCHYRQADRAKAVHLYHDRIPYMTPNQKVMWHYNRNMYLSRRRILARNKHGNWGQEFKPKQTFEAWNPDRV